MELGGDGDGDDDWRGETSVEATATARSTTATAIGLLSSAAIPRRAKKKRKLPLASRSGGHDVDVDDADDAPAEPPPPPPPSPPKERKKEKEKRRTKPRRRREEGGVDGDHRDAADAAAAAASSSLTGDGITSTVAVGGNAPGEESRKMSDGMPRATVAETEESTGASAAKRAAEDDDSSARRNLLDGPRRGAAPSDAPAAAKRKKKSTRHSTKRTAVAAPKTKTKTKASAATSRKKKKGGGTSTGRTGKRKRAASASATTEGDDDSSLAASENAAASVDGDGDGEGEGGENEDKNEDDDDDEMYRRHLREFERTVDRLERVDPFAFFIGEVPPCLDDSDGDGGGDADDDVVRNDASSPLHVAAAAEHGGSDDPVPPSPAAAALADEDGNRGQIADERQRRRKPRPGGVGGGGDDKPERPPFNFVVLRRRMAGGRYVLDRVRMEGERRLRLRPGAEAGDDEGSSPPPSVKLAHPRGVDWSLFRSDVVAMTEAAISRDPRGRRGSSGTLGHASVKIQRAAVAACDRTGPRHAGEMEADDVRRRFRHLTAGNDGGAVQSEWRRRPFPERGYERLEGGNVACPGLSEWDEVNAEYELRTSLPDGFVGMPYNYDEADQSEEWMKSLGEAALAAAESRPASRGGKGGGGAGAGGQQQQDAKARRAAAALEADDGVVRAQVSNTVQALLMRVQEKCMTEMGILGKDELRSVNGEVFASSSMSMDVTSLGEDDAGHGSPSPVSAADDAARVPAGVFADAGDSGVEESDSHAAVTPVKRQSPPPAEVAEHAVWGIDCYTRRNVSRCLWEDLGPDRTEEFIERWLLPSINACPTRLAHDIAYAARVLEGGAPDDFENEGTSTTTGASSSAEHHHQTVLGRAIVDKVRASGPPWLADAARQLRQVASAFPDAFRIHPKGHGAICVKPGGIAAHSLVTHYRGEIYPSWRWGEKMDAIEETQRRLELRPALADFYNMTLERPRNDPRGYGLLFVDASRRAGFGSSFSHSCSPTCEVRVVAVGGRLSLAITTAKDVELGEELTFDYNAVTESVDEYMAAICLCGHTKCRGSFLHYATADCYQQVLERNSPVAVRLAGLIRSCTKRVLSNEDASVLARHGFGTAAFGAVSFRRDDDDDDASPGLRPTIRDSMDNVPVWLRTFVADTLRYIEYERRALPVALLCNHFGTADDHNEKSSRQQPKASSPSLKKKVGGESKTTKASVRRKKTTSKKTSKKEKVDPSRCSTKRDVDSSSSCTGLSASSPPTLPPQQDNRIVVVTAREEFPSVDGDSLSVASSPSALKCEADAMGSDHESSTAAKEDTEENEKTNSVEAVTRRSKKSPSKSSVAGKNCVSSALTVPAPSSPPPNPVPTRPVSPFIYYSQRKQDDFLKILTDREGGMSDLNALQQMQAVQKIAGDEWRRLSSEEKQQFKKAAVADFEACRKAAALAGSDATAAGVDSKCRESTSTREPQKAKPLAKKKSKKGVSSKKGKRAVVTKLKKGKNDGHVQEADTLSKTVRGSKALSSFLYFSGQKRDEFIGVLEKSGEAGNLKGIGLVRATQKIAGEEWGKLTQEEKQAWKDASIRDWEASGGHKKAKMEQNRKRKLIQVEKRQAALKVKNEAEESRVKQIEEKSTSEATKENKERQEEEDARKMWERVESETGRDSKNDVSSSGDASQPISFVAADAEGRSSMEQRIQALTQTLSRVGRALSRHRDAATNKPTSSGGCDDIHAPLRLLTNEEVVYHMWNREGGVVRSLVDCAKLEPCCSSSLKDGLAAITSKYSHLDAFDGLVTSKQEPSPISSFEARRSLNNALLEFRRCILTALKIAEDDERDIRTRREDLSRQSEKNAGAIDTTTIPAADVVKEENCGNPVNDSPEVETSYAENKSAEKDHTCPKCFDLLPCKCALSTTGILEEDITTVISRDAEAVMMENRICSAGKFLIVRSEDVDDEPEHESTESARKAKTVSCSSYESSLENSHLQNTSHTDEVFRESTGDDAIESPQEGVSDLGSPAGIIHNDEAHATPSPDFREGQGVDISLSMSAFSFDFSPSSSNDLSWQEFRSRKYRLEAAADVLLMYAHTSTFLALEPYASFDSTPINVYARELGNKVPRSLIEEANEYGASSINTTGKFESLEFHRSSPFRADSPKKCAIDDEDGSKGLQDDASIRTQSTVRSGDGSLHDEDDTDSVSSQRRGRKRKKAEKKIREVAEEYCKPEEAVTSVSRKYSGEYVLSQLLQWFNGGIGTTPGLPDMLGCAMLPSMRSCWGNKEEVLIGEGEGGSRKTVRPESYVMDIQPQLIEWLDDRVSRGSCWHSLLQSFFAEKANNAEGICPQNMLLGSPVLDLLVTGDDSNIRMVLHGLKHRTSHGGSRNPQKATSTVDKKSRKERLQSKMDEGMPPQAVSNWVQCENPRCLKWRKLPFHVDVDLLPEAFFCKDNVWNPASSSCDAPPDPWDEHQETTASCKLGNIGESDLVLKERFDVFRKKSKKYLVAQVVETDFLSDVKKVKFHFQRLKKEHDEWIEVGSTRIAPLHSFTAKKKKGKCIISGGDMTVEIDQFSNSSEVGEKIHASKNGTMNAGHAIT